MAEKRWNRSARARARRAPDQTGTYAMPPRELARVEDCWFYHSIDLPSYGELVGAWDLRPGIDDYLGPTQYDGRRVLEVGPASGYVTSELERRGAEVVGFEAGSSADYNMLPAGYPNAPAPSDYDDVLRRLSNAFWLVHHDLKLRAKMHYGYVGRVPDVIGDFDTTFIGAVLLHIPDPIGVVMSCAARTRETFVITDVRSFFPNAADRRGEPVAVFFPTVANRVVDRWWTFSPEFFVQLLATLGFTNSSITYHDQLFVQEQQSHPMFTVVASR